MSKSRREGERRVDGERMEGRQGEEGKGRGSE